MTGYEPQISGFGEHRSTNSATTNAQPKLSYESFFRLDPTIRYTNTFHKRMFLTGNDK